MALSSVLLLALPLLACKDKATADSGLTADDTGVSELEPGPLVAGFASARIPAPVGIGTAGNGPFGAPDSESPFAEIYPATTHLHGHPELKAVALSRGEGFELVFVRFDTIGVFQQLRRAVVLELLDRTGKDYDDVLIMGATHTHSGPGRVIDAGSVFDIIADRFLPEYYALLIDTIVDTILAAEADARPARLGTAVGACTDGHYDRRCEDGEKYQNDTMPLFAIERDGQVDTVVVAYPVHGTVLGLGELTLSQDVSGAIEQAVEDRFDHPVEVIMFNAWGADMGPGDPVVDAVEGAADRPGGYDGMERVGAVVADAVQEAMAAMAWTDEPALGAETVRVPIDRDVIGYADDEFDYDYGGVYCEAEGDCDFPTTYPELDSSCLPFSESYPAPNQTMFTIGEVGPLTLLTFPGEPGTRLAEQVMDGVRAQWGAEDFFFMGYGQDYIGYSILEEDWWYGGYEASGALWGPRQGEYLAERAVEIAGVWEGEARPSDEPDPITPFDDPVFDPYVAEEALAAGTVETDVLGTYGRTDTVSLTVLGSDPWLGAPLATVETADGTPVLRPNGVPVRSDDYEFHVDLVTDPTYGDDIGPTTRSFLWTFHMPVQRTTPGWTALEPGEYRLRVVVPTVDGDVEVESAVFTVVD